MARVEKRDNYCVIVWPRSPGDFGFASISGQQRAAEEDARICEGIAEQIKRHVDKFEYDRGQVQVAYDTRYECSRCGSPWTEDSREYNGGCCAADEANDPDGGTA